MEPALNRSATKRRVTSTLSTTVLVVQDSVSGEGATSTAGSDLDVGFIVALVCFAIGGLLLLIGFIKVLVWYVDSRKHEKYSKWWLRQLEHRRHLEEYSIRTGEMASQYSTSAPSLTNQGFSHEEEEDSFSQSERRTGSPVATSTLSATTRDATTPGVSLAKLDGRGMGMGVGIGMGSGMGAGMGLGNGMGSGTGMGVGLEMGVGNGMGPGARMGVGMNRQDKNMNEIMDYL